MARPKRLILPHPITPEVKIRVTFLVRSTETYTGFDEFDEDEANVEIQLRAIEELRGEEFVNVSAEWKDRAAELEEVEEQVRDTYVERAREKYADRLSGRY